MSLVEQFKEGKILLIDKPIKWTSFDVIRYIRKEIKRKLYLKDLKIGHAGTLDPLATGLMILCTGKMTKCIHKFMELDKEYIGEMILGFTTPSYDNETEIDAQYPVDNITTEQIYSTAKKFIGVIEQYPPAYSAVKIKGVRACDLVRRGIEVQLKPRTVQIFAFDILQIDNYRVSFRVRCSKGTYIRSLVNDFGKMLQSGAYLNQLRRTAIGDYRVENAMLPSDFAKMLDREIDINFENKTI